MNNFHYNQDPLYSAAASVLTGQRQLKEDKDKTLTHSNVSPWGVAADVPTVLKNKGWQSAYGFPGVGGHWGLMSKINDSIKSAAHKFDKDFGKNVTGVFIQRGVGPLEANDWILRMRTPEGMGYYVAIVDGGKPVRFGFSELGDLVRYVDDHFSDNINESTGEFYKGLIGKKVKIGTPSATSPNEMWSETILKINPTHTNKWRTDYEIEFKSGISEILTIDELEELVNKQEVYYTTSNNIDGYIKLNESTERKFHKSLIGMDVLHGSPGYENKETIANVSSHPKGFEVEFESGNFTVISKGDLEDLFSDGETFYKDLGHGGLSTIQLLSPIISEENSGGSQNLARFKKALVGKTVNRGLVRLMKDADTWKITDVIEHAPDEYGQNKITYEILYADPGEFDWKIPTEDMEKLVAHGSVVLDSDIQIELPDAVWKDLKESSDNNFREVSKEEFYKIVYDKELDVHPSKYDDEEGFTPWQFRDRTLFGRSKTKRIGHELVTTYYLKK